MKLSRTIALGLSVSAMLLFSGCAKYYATAPVKHEIPVVSTKVPVKVEVTQSGWSMVIHESDAAVEKHVKSIISNSPVFVENNTSNHTLKIDIMHSNPHAGLGFLGATLTGLSLYAIPSIADSDVNITVSSDEIKNTYNGELVVAQGSVSSAMIDANKYTADKPNNLLTSLIKNALDEFTIVYLQNLPKDPILSLSTETTK